MNYEIAEKKRRLRNPAVRSNVLAEVRSGLWAERLSLGLSRSRMETLDVQLQAPPMFLYADGSCEVVVPAMGPDMALTLEWDDLTVRLVAEQGSGDLNAGEIVWSHAHAA